jgi:hypothetical protein
MPGPHGSSAHLLAVSSCLIRKAGNASGFSPCSGTCLQQQDPIPAMMGPSKVPLRDDTRKVLIV